MAHRTTVLHKPLLEFDERLGDAASHDAEAKHCEVRRFLLRVAYELERDGPRPENGDEREAALVEHRPRCSICSWIDAYKVGSYASCWLQVEPYLG